MAGGIQLPGMGNTRPRRGRCRPPGGRPSPRAVRTSSPPPGAATSPVPDAVKRQHRGNQCPVAGSSPPAAHGEGHQGTFRPFIHHSAAGRSARSTRMTHEVADVDRWNVPPYGGQAHRSGRSVAGRRREPRVAQLVRRALCPRHRQTPSQPSWRRRRYVGQCLLPGRARGGKDPCPQFRCRGHREHLRTIREDRADDSATSVYGLKEKKATGGGERAADDGYGARRYPWDERGVGSTAYPPRAGGRWADGRAAEYSTRGGSATPCGAGRAQGAEMGPPVPISVARGPRDLQERRSPASKGPACRSASACSECRCPGNSVRAGHGVEFTNDSSPEMPGIPGTYAAP